MTNMRSKKAIRKIAVSGVRANVKKYMSLIWAVVLTTMLFSSLFTIGGSMINEMKLGSMRAFGTEAHSVIKGLTESEYNQIKNDSEVKDASYRIIVGRESTNEIADICYIEPKDAKLRFCNPEKGRLPKKVNEIATSDLVLDSLDVPHDIGTEFDMAVNVKDKVITEHFVLCGFYRGDSLAPIQQALVSKSFQKKYAENGRLTADITFENDDNIEEKTQNIIHRYGLDNSASYDVNVAYFSGGIDESVIAFGGLILLVFFLAGYLIIYNIFDINIVSDMQEYGLLKSIGTTQNQIKKVVKKRARIVSFVGIPIGLSLGIGVGSYLLPMVSNSFATVNVDKGALHLNVWIILLTSLFSYFTVMFSAGRPCKKAAKVSPIENIRCATKVNKKGKPKKKMLVVIMSMSLSLVILNSVLGFVGGFNMDEYVKDLVIADFTIQSKSLDDDTYTEKNLEGVDEELVNELQDKKGIRDIGKVYVCGSNQMFTDDDWAKLENGILSNDLVKQKLVGDKTTPENESSSVNQIEETKKKKVLDGFTYGMNEYAVSKLKVIKTIDGNKKIDWDKFNSGKYVLITRWCYDEWYQDEDMYVNFFEPGDKINLTSQAPEYEVMKEVKEQSGYSYSYATYEGHPWEEYEVYGIVEIPQELGMRSFGDFCLNYVLPEDDYISLNGNRGMLRTILDVDNNKVDEYNTWLNNYVENVNTELSVKSKESEIDKYEHISKMIRVIGLFLALILGFIGLMNFANTIVTSIIVRSRELAMLSAVGMTKKQQNRRLMKEGAVYFVWTAIMSVIITSILSLMVLKPFMSIFPMFDWQFTLLPIAISLPFILLLVVSIPRITYNKLSKNSIADRLREQ